VDSGVETHTIGFDRTMDGGLKHGIP
jgi:hypothetical protein